VHSKHSGTFGHVLVTRRNVLLMLKTFEVHSKWRNIERHLKCILTALWLLSKYSCGIPTAFHTFWSHSRWNPSSSCFSILGPTLHQLIKHGRLHSRVVEERLWVFYSELLHQSGVMSIQPSYYPLPAMDESDIFWVFSSSFFSWPPRLFKADLAGGQLSGAKQVVQRVHTVQRLTNENAKFGSILYPIEK